MVRLGSTKFSQNAGKVLLPRTSQMWKMLTLLLHSGLILAALDGSGKSIPKTHVRYPVLLPDLCRWHRDVLAGQNLRLALIFKTPQQVEQGKRLVSISNGNFTSIFIEGRSAGHIPARRREHTEKYLMHMNIYSADRWACSKTFLSFEDNVWDFSWSASFCTSRLQ